MAMAQNATLNTEKKRERTRSLFLNNLNTDYLIVSFDTDERCVFVVELFMVPLPL
jgi:hypothetical protein